MHTRGLGFPVARRLGRAAALGLAALASAASADPGWDMAGVRLGMTEAEVRAAFQAYDPKAKVMAGNSSFTYNDGLNTHRTPAFLNTIEMRITRLATWTPIKVWFSGPASPPRVIAIARNEGNLPNPASREQFLQSLQAKYGPPTGQWTGSAPFWEARGKPSCISTKIQGRVDMGDFPQVTTGHKALEQAVGQLEARAQQPSGFYGARPADLKDCGTFMYYTAGLDPVTLVDGGIYDVGAIVATLRARQAWVEGLRSEAVRKREGQGQAPRL